MLVNPMPAMMAFHRMKMSPTASSASSSSANLGAELTVRDEGGRHSLRPTLSRRFLGYLSTLRTRLRWVLGAFVLVKTGGVRCCITHALCSALLNCWPPVAELSAAFPTFNDNFDMAWERSLPGPVENLAGVADSAETSSQ